MKRILAVFLALMLMTVCLPVLAEEESTDDDTAYSVRPVELEKIESEGTLVLELYGVNILQGDPGNIPAGWQFTQLGKQLTVKEVIKHSADEYEIIAQEDTFESIVFKRLVPGMDIWGVWLNDCQSVGLSEVLEVKLPLDDDFVFVWEAPEEEDNITYTADEFIQFLLGDEGQLFNQYNSEVVLRNGRLIRFSHRDYPAGLDLD